jgi:predicted lipoprotein with Yx(FWY)xxD motif
VVGVVPPRGAGGGADDGDDEAADSTAETSTSTTEAPEETTTTTEAATEPAGTALGVADSEFGPIVTDEAGVTLYVFTRDSGGQSACVDQCASTWPPLVAEGEPAGSPDVTGELGTIERPDGSSQVTLGGMPLYHYAPDGEQPGSVQGQGVGGVWFVVGPDGTLIQTAPS